MARFLRYRRDSEKAGLEEESEAVEEEGQDPFIKLPREIIDIILSYLDHSSIKTVRLVSRLSVII